VSIDSSSGLAIKVAGSMTSLPSMAKFGVIPVTLWTVILYAAITVSNFVANFEGCPDRWLLTSVIESRSFFLFARHTEGERALF